MNQKQLKFDYLATNELIPYARNARKHSEQQITKIASSIREFGFLAPIIIDDNHTIIAGHGRVLAAQKLGLDKVPCVKASHLSDTQRRAYTLADNKIALLSEWDDDLLKIEIDELKLESFDLEVTGFTLSELDSFEFSPDLTPEEDPLGNSTPSKFILQVIFETDEERQSIFCELRDRGLKVKA